MFRNWVTVAIRNLFKQKLYTCINVLGLAIGMACSLLIILYIENEMGYNQQFDKANQIFKVIRETTENTGSHTFSERTSAPLGPELKNQFPEVQASLRLLRRDAWVTAQNETINMIFCASDLNALDFFGLKLKKGNPKTALKDPKTVLLTESAAKKLFGSEDPIEKSIQVEGYFVFGDYKVAGIIADLPARSTLQFDILASNTLISQQMWSWNMWIQTGWHFTETYVLLPQRQLAKPLEEKMQSLIQTHMGDEFATKNRYHLQSFDSIYLHSASEYNIKKADYGGSGIVYGNIKNIQLASIIAGVILLIACINFVNLSTARSAKRAREVGLRKTVGASRGSIALQFLGESVLLSGLAFMCTIGFVELAIPAFGDFVGKNLYFGIFDNPLSVFFACAIFFFVGLLAGSYPAFYLSSFHPNDVLKQSIHTQSRRMTLRKVLVVFQFSISIVLIIGTMISAEQLMYIQNKDLGFEKAEIMTLPIFSQATGEHGENLKRRYNTVKQAFTSNPNVLFASASRFAFGGFSPQALFHADGQSWQFRLFPIEEDFIPTFNIELLEGRNFTREHAELYFQERDESGRGEMFIINETAAKMLGWKNPVGKKLDWRSRSGVVIGMVKDFHFQSLKHKVEPTVLVTEFKNLKILYLKINPHNFSETLVFVKKTWEKFLPNRPFTLSFLDERLNKLYQDETRFMRTFALFSGLAIFVGCLGLFGLSSFIAEQRTREIGIRKILGASTNDIIGLLIQQFAKLVIIAAAISMPFAYVLMENWLADFPYRIDLTYSPFLLGALAALGVALTTVSYHALSAALANPANALRQE